MLGRNLGLQAHEQRAMEKRHGRRFQLNLGCRVTLAWRESRELSGSTANISRSGVKIVFHDVERRDELPGTGESVRILIDLPHSTNITPRCLECLGAAVRAETLEDGRFAVAFEIRRIRVCDRSGQAFQPGDSLLASILLHGPLQ